MSVGRPRKYTPKLANKVCALLAEGMSMRKVAEQKGMPSKSSMFGWLAENDEFLDQYTRAKQEAADSLVEEMLEIADDEATTDLIIDDVPVLDPETGKPYKILTSAGVQHARLRVETRKWISSKLKPKKYGDKVEQTHVGADGKDLNWTVEFVNANDKLKEGK